jgi:hypothetical protein
MTVSQRTHAPANGNSAGGAWTPSHSNAKWAKPLPKPKKNFIPNPHWLAYNWHDRDPELEFVNFAIAESGWTLEKIEHECEAHGHRVSRYTLMAWTMGATKRPMNSTMNTVMAVLGYERHWTRQG